MLPISKPPEVTLTSWSRHPSRSLFEFAPELRTIWRSDLAEMAAFHTKQWETDSQESGEVLTASVGESLVGMTGWYQMTKTEAGLRWHGVLPAARKNGYSRQMVEMVCQAMPSGIRYVYEVTRNPQSCAAFRQCGFEVLTDPKAIHRVVRQADYEIQAGGWVLRRQVNSARPAKDLLHVFN